MGNRNNTTEDETEKSISLADIYNAVKYLNAEDQELILSCFKIGELCSLFNNEEGFKSYLKKLSETAGLYIWMMNALSALRTEALKAGGVKWESDMVSVMEKAYEGLSDWGQERFCRNMVGNAGFFQKIYRMIMDTFHSVFTCSGNAEEEHKHMLKRDSGILQKE